METAYKKWFNLGNYGLCNQRGMNMVVRRPLEVCDMKSGWEWQFLERETTELLNCTIFDGNLHEQLQLKIIMLIGAEKSNPKFVIVK